MSELWQTDLRGLPYAQRCDDMLSRGLGLWDVYAACERTGSLDSAIKSAQVNDLSRLKRVCLKLEAIAHNGGESAKHIRRSHALGLVAYQLPSTSPANATWSYGRKLNAWRDVFARHGLASV